MTSLSSPSRSDPSTPSPAPASPAPPSNSTFISFLLTALRKSTKSSFENVVVACRTGTGPLRSHPAAPFSCLCTEGPQQLVEIICSVFRFWTTDLGGNLDHLLTGQLLGRGGDMGDGLPKTRESIRVMLPDFLEYVQSVSKFFDCSVVRNRNRNRKSRSSKKNEEIQRAKRLHFDFSGFLSFVDLVGEFVGVFSPSEEAEEEEENPADVAENEKMADMRETMLDLMEEVQDGWEKMNVSQTFRSEVFTDGWGVVVFDAPSKERERDMAVDRRSGSSQRLEEEEEGEIEQGDDDDEEEEEARAEARETLEYLRSGLEEIGAKARVVSGTTTGVQKEPQEEDLEEIAESVFYSILDGEMAVRDAVRKITDGGSRSSSCLLQCFVRAKRRILTLGDDLFRQMLSFVRNVHENGPGFRQVEIRSVLFDVIKDCLNSESEYSFEGANCEPVLKRYCQLFLHCLADLSELLQAVKSFFSFGRKRCKMAGVLFGEVVSALVERHDGNVDEVVSHIREDDAFDLRKFVHHSKRSRAERVLNLFKRNIDSKISATLREKLTRGSEPRRASPPSPADSPVLREPRLSKDQAQKFLRSVMADPKREEKIRQKLRFFPGTFELVSELTRIVQENYPPRRAVPEIVRLACSLPQHPKDDPEYYETELVRLRATNFGKLFEDYSQTLSDLTSEADALESERQRLDSSV